MDTGVCKISRSRIRLINFDSKELQKKEDCIAHYELEFDSHKFRKNARSAESCQYVVHLLDYDIDWSIKP